MNELLPDNYTVANKHLDYLQKQLTKNKNLFTDYDKVIKQYLKKGIVEYVENNDNKTTHRQVHCLPPQSLIRENNETTKLRIVFDASSKAKGEHCLKDILYSGPCLLPYLYGILLRFCVGKFRLIANIKQAFFQIEITEDHIDLLRFLWFKNINDVSLTPTKLRFTRAVFGLTSSPFLLNGRIKQHLEKYMLNPNFTEIMKKLIMNLYVGDSTNSFNKLQIELNFTKNQKHA